MQLRPNLLELPLGQAGLGLGVGEEFFRDALGQGGRVNGRARNSAGTSRATTTSTAGTTAATAHETRGDFRRVTVQLLRLGQFDFQLCNAILVFRLGSKIVQFMRIVFQVIQRGSILLGTVKQFPPVVADGALVVHVRGEKMIAHLGLFAVDDPGQAFALDLVGDRQAGQPAERRVNVVQINKRIRRAFRDTGAAGENLHA